MKTKLIKGLRKAYHTIVPKTYPRWDWPSEDDWEKTNKILYEILTADKPCYIGRIGTVEGQIVLNRLTLAQPPHKFMNTLKGCRDYITGNTKLPWWDEGKPFMELQRNAGFFSSEGITTDMVERFADLYLHYIPQMDVCGRFEYYEKLLPFSPECKAVQLESLYPFFVERPWMSALKGKKVLVIHPFAETITKQYKIRELLFPNPESLPEFELKTYKAVQSIAGEKTPFNDWFDALDHMKQEISEIDFDVAIIGCGAYGLPLAGYIKEELHRKAIHMGGGTQLLFGIKGKRWEQDYKNPCYRNLFNRHWVYASDNERPQNAKAIEGGCYW